MKNSTFSSLRSLKSLVFMALTLLFSTTYAQSDYAISFQDDAIAVQENIDTFQWSQMPESSELKGGYVGWIQFYETPTQDIQDAFKSNNLKLIEYIPNKTYLFHFDANTSIQFLKDSGVRAIIPVEGRFKLSSNLKNTPYPEHAVDGNSLLVTLEFHDNVDVNFIIQDLARKQIGVLERHDTGNTIDLRIPDNCLDNLSNLSYIKYIDVIPAPSVKEDIRGKGLHRSSNLDTQTLTGRNYDGTGVGVMVRDDGRLGPHIDFEGRIISNVGGSGQTHGDGVGGILTGAGNLDPKVRGMAAGSDIYVVNYNSTFTDNATVTRLTNGDVQITNSSYGNGCNDGYTTTTRTVDSQIHDMPTILHVFSAGNSGTSNCGYGAGSGWGNITGGHKQGKNVIATANTDYQGDLESSSSRGPATDGRIKPDITAHGQGQRSCSENNAYQSFGGTSGAAPGVAGIAAQLYQAYGDANGGALPPSALIKATMLNTANDYGNVGPDYSFGWGLVNGFRAVQLLEDNRYLSDDISQGGSNNHVINVPAGTVEARFMVYWNDPAAATGANPALVNDLDLVVTDPSSGTHLPYILDPTPNAGTLNLPATNGADHLNNMEQVVFSTPAAGNYTINVSGFNVPMGPQEYFVVYELVSDNLTVTYPNEGEKFVSQANEIETIHWDAVNTAASFVVEYSLNNGGSWNMIGTAPANETNIDWTLPTGVATGDALVRVTSGSHSDVSDNTFSIAPPVSLIQFIEVCETTATILWSEVAGADNYDVHVLGEKYMDIVGSTSDLQFTFPITDFNEPIYASVAAKNDADGWVGRRKIAISHAGGLLNCEIVGFDDNTLAENVVMYPNPAQTAVTLDFANINSEINITVTNILGQNMQRLQGVNGSATINVSNYTTGVYFVTINAGNSTTTKKLVVK